MAGTLIRAPVVKVATSIKDQSENEIKVKPELVEEQKSAQGEIRNRKSRERTEVYDEKTRREETPQTGRIRESNPEEKNISRSAK